MTLDTDFEDFINLLNKFEVEYLIIGGYAMAIHGKPRYTGDLDIWINISDSNAEKMLLVLDAFGFSKLNFKKEDFLKENFINQIGYPPLRIDIITTIDGINFHDAYEKRKIINLDSFKADYIGLAHLIQNKIVSGRPQDLVDVQNLTSKK